MIPPVEAIRSILWNRIVLDGKKIPVVKRSYPYDKTPCVTIDDSGASKFYQRHIITEPYPVDESHPQYNPHDPDKLVPQQVIREDYSATINVNVWSDTIDEQEKLNNIIADLFYKAQTDHYMFCTNYNQDDNSCGYLGDTCKAYGNRLDKKGVKYQCPSPYDFHYENIFKKHNLVRASFHVNPAFNLDDLNRKEILYRSVIRVETGYYIDYIVGGLKNTGVDNSVNISRVDYG